MTGPAELPMRLSTDELRIRLSSRLDELGSKRSDLAPALALQRALLSRQIELLDVLLAGGLPSLSLPPRYLAAKLAGGVPALHGEPVPLPLQLLTLTLRDFCERLRSGSTEGPVDAVIQAIDTQGLDAGALLS